MTVVVLVVVLALALAAWVLWDHFLPGGRRGAGIGAGYVGLGGDGYTATCWHCGQTAPFDLAPGVGVGDEVVLGCRECGAQMEAVVGELAGSGSTATVGRWPDQLRDLWHEIATHGISLHIRGRE